MKLKELEIIQNSKISNSAKLRLVAQKENLKKMIEEAGGPDNGPKPILSSCEHVEPWFRMMRGESFVTYNVKMENKFRVKATRFWKLYKARFWVIRHKKMKLIEVVRAI